MSGLTHHGMLMIQLGTIGLFGGGWAIVAGILLRPQGDRWISTGTIAAGAFCILLGLIYMIYGITWRGSV